MKKPTLLILPLLILLIVVLVVVCACGNVVNFKTAGSRHKVVVVHSWDSVGEEKDLFSNCMEKAFKAQNVDVDICHIYANMVHRPQDVFSRYDAKKMVERIRRQKPEVILLNDDPIVEWLLTQESPDSLFLNTPIVFAGVNSLLRDSVSRFPLMTGFEARVNLRRNIEELMRMGSSQDVVIELDYGGADDRLRAQFTEEMKDTTFFVDNSDFHLRRWDKEFLRQNYLGLAVVNFVSCALPYMNCGKGESNLEGRKITGLFYQQARDRWHLQVKRDIFSNSLICHAGRPQFTCIREQFGNPLAPMFVCGYFTGTETQVEDQVRYAARIIKGAKPKSLPIGLHVNDYYMDWNAMQIAFPNAAYGVYSSKFHIVNVPFYLEHPVLFIVGIGLLVLFILVVIYLIVLFLTRWKTRGQKQLMEELLYEEKMHDLIFSNTKDTLWEYDCGVFTFSKQFSDYLNLPSNRMTEEEMGAMVHPESKASFDFLKNFRNQRGKKTVRMRLSPDGNRWYWGEVIYTATDASAQSGKLYGLLMNIDKKKETEEQLERAQKLASQVALKESFLANISHDLRTPLGAVTGFSTLLTTPGITFEEGEREMYGELIHQNTDMILNMIDSVMKKAQLETGDLEIIQKPVSIQKVIDDCYKTNQIIAPTHLQFILEKAEPDAIVNIDSIRTKQVINNFLSNAFKFTPEGSVTLGWKYVEDSDKQLEVYVKDTGIGVEQEKQALLFERYTKVNETDHGIGLGLNISKIIIERQGGTIGVESCLGKGSKFFFRLSKYMQSMLLLIVMAVGLILPSSCFSRYTKEEKSANVLVFHSYERGLQSYRTFNDQLTETFRDNVVNVNMRHAYLDLENPAGDTREKHVELQDSLRDKGWCPDIVLVEGDRAAADFLQWQAKGNIDELNRVPVIFGGLHHPDWEMIRKRNNIVVLCDPIDYCTNINLAVEFSGKNCVEIELDHFKQDSLIRKELRQAIARPPYIDNSDFHIQDITDEKFSSEWKDSIMVLVYSTALPGLNTHEGYDRDAGLRNLRSIYVHSWLYPSVAVKYDIYSSLIADKTERPQFTAVKAGFANGDGRYLCGYFASYATVGKDMAQVASEIIRGADLTSFVGIIHEKGYYMDYQAMRALGLEYDDYKERFDIVGAPMEKKMPLVVYGTWGIIGLVFLSTVFALLLVLMTQKTQTAMLLMEELKHRSEIRNMVLHGADCQSVRSEASVKDIITHLHPDYANELLLLTQAIDIVGTHNYEVFLDLEGDGVYRWWQLRFVVMYDNKTGRKNVEGILINIDESKRYEDDFKKAKLLAEEARQKEDFLMTISHEIRTPLNAVVGFSDVIVSMPPESFSEEELAEFEKIIKENNASLTTMIENILMFSRIESGSIQYVNAEFDASELMKELENEWKGALSDCVDMHLIAVQPGIIVNKDRERVKYILNLLISNAVKFTERGLIIIGVSYHLDTDKVDFIVGDTGCGIPKDKQGIVFDLFWKDNGFVPGLGLGLNVAKKMADGMGMQLALESRVGFGSKFFLISDADLRHVTPPAGGKDAPPSTSSESKTSAS